MYNVENLVQLKESAKTRRKTSVLQPLHSRTVYGAAPISRGLNLTQMLPNSRLQPGTSLA